jgi:hypothetical protein
VMLNNGSKAQARLNKNTGRSKLNKRSYPL